jgi:hypothetical protein
MNGRDDRKREIGRFSEHWTMQQTIIGLVHDSEEEHFVKMAYVFFPWKRAKNAKVGILLNCTYWGCRPEAAEVSRQSFTLVGKS